MSIRLMLEKDNGDVVRSFLMTGESAHVIERRDTKRLEVVPDLEALVAKKIKFNELGQIRRENLDNLDFEVPGPR